MFSYTENMKFHILIVCRLLAEADGSEVLVQLLTDSMAECRQFAADCITNMAPDG